MNAWGSRKFVEASLGIPGIACFFPPFNLLQQTPLQHAQNRRQATFLIWLAKGQNFLGSLPSPYYIQSNEWTSTGRNEVERLVS